jgi:mannitol-specific phosphotransferase system IIBC component
VKDFTVAPAADTASVSPGCHFTEGLFELVMPYAPFVPGLMEAIAAVPSVNVIAPALSKVNVPASAAPASLATAGGTKQQLPETVPVVGHVAAALASGMLTSGVAKNPPLMA